MIVCCLLRTLIWILVLLTERFLIRIVSTSLALLEGKYVTSAYDNMAPLFAIEKDTRQHMHVQVKRRLWLWAYSFTPATLWTPSWFRCWAVSTRFIFCGKKKKNNYQAPPFYSKKDVKSLSYPYNYSNDWWKSGKTVTVEPKTESEGQFEWVINEFSKDACGMITQV